MKKLATIIVVLLLIFLALPIVFRKHTVPLLSNGKMVAIATRPFVMPWNDNEFTVYTDKTKLFGLWGDAFDGPVFIYPFNDNKRYLCVDDDDTCVLVFVVDFSFPSTNTARSFGWPLDVYTQNYMAGRSTNVVMDTKGYVRLPNYAEVQEVSDYLIGLSQKQFKTMLFPSLDLGMYRFYWSKAVLLSVLAANRTGAWPSAE
jgi:hypothetical protein